ncbi:hypothetical protein ACNKHL_19765 [Shigella flexneri]
MIAGHAGDGVNICGARRSGGGWAAMGRDDVTLWLNNAGVQWI